METKLTLRLNELVVRKAKTEAGHRGKSVSRMVAEFFESLDGKTHRRPVYSPLTASLIGVLKNSRVSENDYRKHLKEKHR